MRPTGTAWSRSRDGIVIPRTHAGRGVIVGLPQVGSSTRRASISDPSSGVRPGQHEQRGPVHAVGLLCKPRPGPKPGTCVAGPVAGMAGSAGQTDATMTLKRVDRGIRVGERGRGDHFPLESTGRADRAGDARGPGSPRACIEYDDDRPDRNTTSRSPRTSACRKAGDRRRTKGSTRKARCSSPRLSIDEFAGWATPRQVDAVHRLLDTELARDARSTRLCAAPGSPSSRGLDGYDFTNVRLPDGYMLDERARFIPRAGPGVLRQDRARKDTSRDPGWA